MVYGILKISILEVSMSVKLLGFVIVLNFSRWLKASLEGFFFIYCSFEPTGVFGVVCFVSLCFAFS